MDMKQKLEGIYNPEKEGRKERVIIGLSGGIDSLVSAYLLKIQKYDLFAVTVALGIDGFPGNKSQTMACFLDESRLEFLREFCHQLNIPHHVVKATSEFQESVVEEWMAAKITGTTANQCWSCHGLRMAILHQKMVDLDGKFLATGHYAKLFHHASHDTYFVHTSNDEQHDQSALLTRLPSTILKSLMLPLSDLQKKEVLRLADNFGISSINRPIKMHHCFPNNEATANYLRSRIPVPMVRTGEITNLAGDQNYGEHTGVINYTFGEDQKSDKIREGLFFVKYSYPAKRMYLEGSDYFMQGRVHLVDCEYSEELSLTEPFRGVIELVGHNLVECWVYPKSLKGARVEWEGKHQVLPGEIVTIFKKKGKNSRVYLTGKTRLIPETKVASDDEAETSKPAEIDFIRDF